MYESIISITSVKVPFVENLFVDPELVNLLNCAIFQFQQVNWTEAQHKDPTLRKLNLIRHVKIPRISDIQTSANSLALAWNFHFLIIGSLK